MFLFLFYFDIVFCFFVYFELLLLELLMESFEVNFDAETFLTVVD